MTQENQVVLDAKGITKKFPGVLANDNVNFDLRKGEIHVLLGENGAGKSTLVNILYGLYKADAGEILVDGREMILHSPKDAIHHGIGMVHQHFMLIPVFTVTENIMLGAETDHRASRNESPLVKLDRKEVAQKVRELSHRYGLDV
ncbi:MAG TPA: ATP-binding cassette domain-containing protein, partial [Anaerolineales bacterium]|nr:ATP-binding cassette domain-containing protein [Anaerolineales bacterium]